MKTELTVIVDNIADSGIQGEWGLCILVEYNGRKILVDAGGSKLFLKNFKKLGFDVRDIDYGILSHAHYDHANGIPYFFKNNSKAKFYLQKEAAANCYHKKRFFRVYIGIPKCLLSKYSDRIEFVNGDVKIEDGVYLIPHKTPGLSSVGIREHMFRRIGKNWIPDDFSHEQSLVLDTEKGLVIINSCSHGGAANIINEVQKTFPDKHVYGIIGGFHLFNKSEEEILALAQKIKETGIEYICTGHCTKDRAFSILKKELGGKIQQMRVGYKINF
ncbi:MAG: MBL fold metallo-hydrolase [Treponema sp.]|nr:MBL fold metallo-hydrolase [Treponema sp.]